MIERITKNCTLLVVTLLVLAGCEWGSKKDTGSSSATSDKLLVVNVLSPELYNDAHIAGSINVPLADLQNTAQKWDKNAAIIIYCSNYTCSASTGGARILKNSGFTNVSAYEGGMAQWHQLAQEDNTYAVEGPAKEDYLKVKVSAPSQPTAEDVTIISAQELRDKLRGNKN